MRYFFEDYALDIDRRELRRGAELVPTTPQVFDLLHYLICNRERVVSKDELINVVWKGRIVSDAALTTRLNATRSAIGDTGEQRLIKTLPRAGFRFIGTVRMAQRPAVAPVSLAAQSGDMSPGSLSPPRLSIVVLPFANLNGDPEQDYFVDGVTESLTTDLSRISGSFVIGRHTAFAYRSKAADLKQIGRELNVRYILEGSVQRAGSRLRVNVRLVDAQGGNHIWAERFDKPGADLFDMQDEIVSRLANELDAQLIAAEAQRAEHSLHPDATDLVFQGRARLNNGLNPEHMAQARDFFERALVLDPSNIEAMVSLARANLATGASFATDDRTPYLNAAETGLIKVLSIAPQHARAHVLLGSVLNATNRAIQGMVKCERGLVLDPNLAEAHATIGLAKWYIGRCGETEDHVNEALRLSPRDILAFRWLFYVAVAKHQLGADVEALAWLRRSIEANRSYPLAHFFLAATLALLGEQEQARDAAASGSTLDPTFTIRRYRVNTPSDHPSFLAARQRFYEGMRLAGVPEG